MVFEVGLDFMYIVIVYVLLLNGIRGWIVISQGGYLFRGEYDVNCGMVGNCYCGIVFSWVLCSEIQDVIILNLINKLVVCKKLFVFLIG